MKRHTPKIEHYTFYNIRKIFPDIIGHIACHQLTNDAKIPLHDHDYFEIQCGCEGRAIQMLNGESTPFLSNEIYMLKPEDIHSIHVQQDQTFTFYNIAFEKSRLQFIYDNYHLEKAGQWLNNPDFERKIRLPPMLLESIRLGMNEMLMDKKRYFAIDRFLMNFFFILEKQQRDPYIDCPVWLQETIVRLDDPHWLRMGPRAMEKISGYSLEHISRLLKKHAGVLPRDVLNKIRMEHAATGLALSSKNISDLAYECGLDSLCYFFRLFKKTYGCTPLQYRHSSRKYS